MLRNLWNRWKAFGQKIADFQARLILTLVYFIVVLPFVLIVRWFSDPLQMKKKSRETLWFPKHLDEPTLENSRSQS
jgi:hypothetical protein